MKEKFIICRMFENGCVDYFWSINIFTAYKHSAGRLDSYDACKNIIDKQDRSLKCIYQIEKIFVLS